MTDWRFIDSGPCSASYNMAVDEAVAISVRKGDSPATLRLYGWDRPSVSLGSFQGLTGINIPFCEANGIPIVRRPTGGRAILHGDELTYSFSSASEGLFSEGLLDSYRKLSSALKSALDTLGVRATVKMKRESGRTLARNPLCFKTTSYGEISSGGKKLIGSAQKRWKNGFLQQGSIPYAEDKELMNKIFTIVPPSDLKKTIGGLRGLVKDLNPERFKEALRTAFENTFRVNVIPSSLSPQEIHLAQALESQKYRSREWTFLRQIPVQ